MPTYEYECGACGHRFERFQSITADPIRVCPACKKRKVRRLLGTGGAVLFKGSGFYATDYRSASYKEAARKESGAGKGSDAEKASEAGKKKGADGKPDASKD